MALNGHPKLRIGEVGCGDMGADKADSLGKNFLGIDISLTAMRRAQKVHSMANFIVADAKALPLRDGALDFLLCVNTLPVIGFDLYPALVEMGRVTNSYISLNLMSRQVAHREFEDYKWIDTDRSLLGIFYMDREKTVCDCAFFYFDPAEAEVMMKEMGFKSIHAADVVTGDGLPMVWVDAAKQENPAGFQQPCE